MISINRIVATSLLTLATLSAQAQAQPSTDWPSYQGRLTDNGEPVNGLWNFQIAYYDSETGGSSTYGQVNNDVLVTDGLFTIPLNAYSLLTNAHTEIWLEIQVWPTDFSSPPTTLSPRQPVSPAAKALRADFAYTSATGLSDAYDNENVILGDPASPVTILGTDLIAGQSLQVGQPNGPFSTLSVYSQFSPDIVAQIGPDNTDGGFIRAFQVPGSIHAASIETDSQGGGYLSIARNPAGNIGFEVDGNGGGLNAPAVTLYNNSGNTHTRFDATIPNGDTAAVLPYQSVSEFEILNEAGVAGTRKNAANTALTSSVLPYLTRVIDTPASGTLALNAVAEIRVNHTTGTNSAVTIGFGIGSNGFIQGIENRYVIPAALPTAQYDIVLPVHDLYPVLSAASYEVRMLLNVTGGTATIVDCTLSALYFPTEYGLTASSVLHNPDNHDSQIPIAPLNPNELALERQAEQEWSQRQLINYMRRLEARVEAQQAEIKELQALQQPE